MLNTLTNRRLHEPMLMLMLLRNYKIEQLSSGTFPQQANENSNSDIFCLQCLGSPMAVQWLRLLLPMQRVQVQFLVGELRPHMTCRQKNNRSSIITNSVKHLKNCSRQKTNLKKICIHNVCTFYKLLKEIS